MTTKIFLSYTDKDKEKVKSLYQELLRARFKPWMDKIDLVGGQRWKYYIEQAIKTSDFFLACLSLNSVNKRGYLQKEIKDALQVWEQKRLDDIYLIPVRLENCEVPEELRDFHWVSLFEEDGLQQLLKAIKVGMASQAKKDTAPADLSSPIRLLNSKSKTSSRRGNNSKSKKKPKQANSRDYPIDLKAAKALGIIGCVPELVDSEWEPVGCSKRVHYSLKFFGLQGSKWVESADAFNAMKRCLERLEDYEEASIQFLLVNPFKKTLMQNIKRKLHAEWDTEHDEIILGKYLSLMEEFKFFQVRLYNHFPYFRIVIIDDRQMAVSRYNISEERQYGWRAPHLILENDLIPGSPQAASLFFGYDKYFKHIWGNKALSAPLHDALERQKNLKRRK